MKKILKLTIAFVLIGVLSLALFACNKDSKRNYSDLLSVYIDTPSTGEFTSYETAIKTIPSGWELYTPVTTSTAYKNSESGYIKSLDAFVLTKNSVLTVFKCGATEPLFAEAQAISALRVSKGLIICKSNNGDMFVCNERGGALINRGVIVGTGNTAIDSVVKVLSRDLIAVNPTYDVNVARGTNYTTIYRASTGQPAMRVRNEGGDIANLEGFDDRYVVCTGTSENSTEVSRIFTIPTGTPSQIVNSDGTAYGTFTENGEDSYYIEITYMGGGKFFIHEDWESTEEDYSYYDGEAYMKVSRHIYDGTTDRLSTYADRGYYFLNLSNHYYGSERSGISADSFLKNGYYYASYGIYIDDNKFGYYDQFILDGNLDIVYSLSGNFGVVLDKVKVDTVSFFDLAVVFTDGVGIVPIAASTMRAFDRNGNILFENDEYTIVTASCNSNMIIASAAIDGKNLFGAFDMQGNVVIPFEYDSINPFTGYYTIGIKGKTLYLLSKDGNIITSMSDGSTPLADIALTSNNQQIYMLGCYMFTETRDNVSYFGIKNFNANTANNVIIPATMAKGSMLYSSQKYPGDVFVFAKYAETDSFTVYRLK